MALVQATLATQIEAAMKASQLDPSPASQTKMAQDIATAIDTFVKTATVTTTVTGTAVGGVCTPSGPVAGATVTGTGTGAPGVGLS